MAKDEKILKERLANLLEIKSDIDKVITQLEEKAKVLRKQLGIDTD